MTGSWRRKEREEGGGGREGERARVWERGKGVAGRWIYRRGAGWRGMALDGKGKTATCSCPYVREEAAKG